MNSIKEKHKTFTKEKVIKLNKFQQKTGKTKQKSKKRHKSRKKQTWGNPDLKKPNLNL
jgi:hypothetical protein